MARGLNLGPARVDELHRMAMMSRDQVEHGHVWRYTAARLWHERRRTDRELVVARDGERIAGFGLMQYKVELAHLILLVVDRPYRRRGVASAIMDWLELMARNAGVFDIELEVRAPNAGAQAFYRARGYHPLMTMPGYYSHREDGIFMRADLRQNIEPRTIGPPGLPAGE
ncbi:MAG: GNAT family N-acetyltransferase [Myxococcota bacterium]